MTSRERLIAATRGDQPDRKPVICWPQASGLSNAVVGSCHPDQICLAAVCNPFGQALRYDILVAEALHDDPVEGESILHGLVAKTRAEMREALEAGADGILYLLYGARTKHTTPMEYGGHYLERDRELLSEVQDAAFNMIFVVGEEDAYLDFVSDLPAHAFAWDSKATGMTVAEMRPMRSGALATNSPDADIELQFGIENPSAMLETKVRESKFEIPISKLKGAHAH